MPIPSSQNGPQFVRKERLAVSLADLDLMDLELRNHLFGGRLDLSVPIRTDGDNADSAAIALTGPLLAVACACDAARAQDREIGVTPLRVYVCRATSWQRLPADAQLTVMAEGRAALNPEIFPESANPVPLSAPTQSIPGRFRR